MTAARKILVGIAVLSAIIGGTYYYFYGREYVYRFTQTQLANALAAKLPLWKTYLFLIQVTLDHPRVELIDGSDRVKVGIDVDLGLGGDAQWLGGVVDGSGGLPIPCTRCRREPRR